MEESPTGILLVNLGTPDSYAPKDVYRYLIEFLTDDRVIDLPWLKRQLLVRGLIVPSRYKQSAKSYEAIWTKQGSPLKVYGEKLKLGLQGLLGGGFHVELAMRYQNPSIESALEKLLKKPLKKLVVVPLFPQYASATTGSIFQKVMDYLANKPVIPETLFIKNFYDHKAFINAFCTLGQRYPLGDYDHILFSFHGLPERHLTKADPSNYCLKKKDCCKTSCLANQHCYAAECHATAYKITEGLNIDPAKTTVCFQSRLGKDPWIKPYTSDMIAHLAKKGAKKVLVFCPAFVADCLETIFEISYEGEAEFKHLGGEKLDLVLSLNDEPVWIEALKEIIEGKIAPKVLVEAPLMV